MATSTTAMSTKRHQRPAKRKARGSRVVRNVGLRPAPRHEAGPTPALGPRILRGHAKGVAARNAATDGGDFAAPALYRLMAWLSPAYPIGAFSYSGGVEWAVEAGDIRDAATLREWLTVTIAEGGGFCDAVFLVHAYRAAADRDDTALRAVAELAAAFAPSKERHLETTAQGRAFLDTTRAAWPAPALDRLGALWDGPVALPVAVGVAGAAHDIALADLLNAYLHALAANLVSAGVRLIPLGQTDGQRVLAALEDVVRATAERARAVGLDDVGAAAFRADLASMRHETQYTRLFRS
jgi:urease accessory protein